MGRKYEFRSVWRLEAPVEKVWEQILHSEHWPEWWPYVVRVVELDPGGENGIGNVRHYEFTCPYRYKLSFQLKLTDREEYRYLRGIATGNLEGEGEWIFRPVTGGCEVECRWEVKPKVAWMRWLHFLLRPVFVYNHERVMEAGERGLKEVGKG